MDITNENCDCFCQFDQLRDPIKYEIVFCPLHEAAPELLEACEAMLPVIQYILTNGWDEAPSLDIGFDEHLANQLAVTAIAKAKGTE